MPTTPTTVAITYDSVLGAQARTDDPLAAALLAHAGFSRVFSDEDDAKIPEDLRGLHSLRPTPSGYDLRRAASHAAEMLRAAKFRVDLDTDLYVGPTTTFTDPQGTKFIGAAVLDAADLVAAADDPDSACRALDQVLDADDGALVRLGEFFQVAADNARAAGDPLASLAPDLDVAAELMEQVSERLAETAEAVRPFEPVRASSTAGLDAARSRAAARARAAGSPSALSRARPGAANHRIAAPLTRPEATPPTRR